MSGLSSTGGATITGSFHPATCLRCCLHTAVPHARSGFLYDLSEAFHLVAEILILIWTALAIFTGAIGLVCISIFPGRRHRARIGSGQAARRTATEQKESWQVLKDIRQEQHKAEAAVNTEPITRPEPIDRLAEVLHDDNPELLNKHKERLLKAIERSRHQKENRREASRVYRELQDLSHQFVNGDHSFELDRRYSDLRRELYELDRDYHSI